MTQNKKKKGFTIVELVIVIGVIGILTAILVPVFINLNKKAEHASDTSLVTNLNIALAAVEAEGSKDNKTMHDAIVDLDDYGFDLAKLVTRSDEKLLWNSKTNRFLLSEDANAQKANTGAKDIDFWQIVNSVPAAQTYSLYAGNGFTAEEASVSVGFDVGYNEGIKTVNYASTAGQTVTLRTNEYVSTLTIDAPSDVVYHYDAVGSVNVISTEATSYHENGTVKFLEVAGGHIVLEADSKVSAVHFTATGEGDAAKFENEDGKKISIDLSALSEENTPTFTRDAVVIDENGTYVAEVTAEETEYIWLFGSGVKEQMVVTSSADAIAENGELKADVTVGAEDGSVADQIANPAKRNSDGQLVDEDDNVIDLEEIDLTKADALDNTVVVEDIASKEDIQIGATLFAGGTGSSSDPFLIVDYATMQNIQTMADLAESGEGGYGFNYYYKVKDGVTEIDCCEGDNIWKTVSLYGHFDGNGVTFNNLVKQSLFNWVEAWDEEGNLVTSQIKNFTVNANIVRSGTATAISYYTRDAIFEDITVHGYVEGGANSGLFVAYGPCIYNNAWVATWNAKFINCSSDATMVNTNGYASRLVGHPACKVDGSRIEIENFSFTGELYSNSANGGRLYSSCNTFNIFYVDGATTPTASNTAAPCSQIKVTVEALPEKYSSFSVAKLSGYDHAVARLIISPNDKNDKGGFTGTYMTESSEDGGIVASGTTISTTNIKYFDIKINGSEKVDTKTLDESGYTADGKTYNVINSFYGHTYNNASVRIIQYNAQGTILGISTFTLPVA